jgi:hypothetical protein
MSILSAARRPHPFAIRLPRRAVVAAADQAPEIDDTHRRPGDTPH